MRKLRHRESTQHIQGHATSEQAPKIQAQLSATWLHGQADLKLTPDYLGLGERQPCHWGHAARGRCAAERDAGGGLLPETMEDQELADTGAWGPAESRDPS